MSKNTLRASCVFLALISPYKVIAQDLDAGLKAMHAGDYDAALQEFKPLAEQGNDMAQFNLALMYMSGIGVTQNYVEAARLMRLTARQGNPVSQTGLALMYAQGNGVTQDYVMAHMWLNIAAAAGYEDARNARDVLTNNMDRSAVAEAQSRARICMGSGYQECD